MGTKKVLPTRRQTQGKKAELRLVHLGFRSQPSEKMGEGGGDTVYLYPDGSQSVFRGGTRTWRNNNPGNVKAGEIAREHGAIGRDEDGFAIFPDAASGDRAMRAPLKIGRDFRDASISAGIEVYAPKTENNTARHQDFVLRVLGVDGTTLIRDLTPQQFETFVGAIQRYEGWRRGVVIRSKGKE